MSGDIKVWMGCFSSWKDLMISWSKMMEAVASNRASCQERSGMMDWMDEVSLRESQMEPSEWL